MTRFVRPNRRHDGAWITSCYILGALLSGVACDPLGRMLFAEGASPLSSSSAVAMLSAMASGMMALTAIVFAIVFVAVQLGNTSYSPRLLGVLGDDHFLAHALGIFSGTFLYALMAIRTIDIVGSPGIDTAVTSVAFLWLLASVIVLVRLLPRIRGLAISEVLVSLQRRACSAASRVYPVELGKDSTAPLTLGPATHVIRYAGPPRYVIGLDLERLVRSASEADALLVVQAAIGDQLIDGDRLAVVHGGTHVVNEQVVREAIWLARERMIDNDPSYAMRLLVDIAIRALSPAVNDPTTAVNVLGELDGVLRFLGRRQLDDNEERDANGVVRVVRSVVSWDELVALALTEIHQYGHDSYQVQHRIAALLRDLAEILPAERAAVLERYAHWRPNGFSASRSGDSGAGRSPTHAHAGAPG